MFIIVVGCGRMGANLARRLVADGHEVTLVDEEAQALARVADLNVRQVIGTGIDTDVLKEAGVERADAVAAMTSRDNTNIMIAQIAEKIFHVPRVLARVNDPLRESVFHAFGVSTISPIALAAEAAHAFLTGGREG